MGYLLIAAAVFIGDFFVKRHMDKKYAKNVVHARCRGRILIEKYYNRGAALNFLQKRPGVLRVIHTALMIFAAAICYVLLKTPGRGLAKTGMALLLGGGLSNLYDRYTKGYVVDYFRINAGPKRFRNIIFNLSDFCIFIGAFLAAGSGGKE